ncbi:sensor histidine kinase [Pseudomonas sp. PLB05]|uniref:sensor histidine kinase n=1 Tax=Pseudomonas sp. PLB05 TaxID=2899078 RepID=UPI001E29BECB|nr:HAMP domain-containing sensor histidine kinase [Pseudomonas sp. PLB05]MCD4865949.1 HAMP domain-containing histidine kinase [Pseudomonas sp. PLB05]
MFGSLRSRLIALLLMLGGMAVGVGWLMILLLRQSESAQLGQATVEAEQACQVIASSYRFYSNGWSGPTAGLADPALRQGLTGVASVALLRYRGMGGGLWQEQAGMLADASPFSLTDAERRHLADLAAAALAEARSLSDSYSVDGATVLMAACPLSGPIPDLAAWTLTRLTFTEGSGQRQLKLGLGLLLLAMLAATLLLGRLTWQWSRHVTRVERDLGASASHDLPTLDLTGERELDRVLAALNQAGQRLAQARAEAQRLTNQVHASERLAALGRVAAGVAHEIRNPLAAMRLKAENALAGDAERQRRALDAILPQIARLDSLLRRLLDLTQPPQLQPTAVDLPALCREVLASHEEQAGQRGIRLVARVAVDQGCFDRDALGRALDNLLLNAVQAAPADSEIRLDVSRRDDWLLLAVEDEGQGPPAELRGQLFEPFVTGRPEGTGLGLALVRETARAHGGEARLVEPSPSTRFEILLPCQPC